MDADQRFEAIDAWMRLMTDRQVLIYDLLKQLRDELLSGSSRQQLTVNSRDINQIQAENAEFVVGASEAAYAARGWTKDEVPTVVVGQDLQCVRCGYVWKPRVAKPRRCARCVAPWWYDKQWKWHDRNDREKWRRGDGGRKRGRQRGRKGEEME